MGAGRGGKPGIYSLVGFSNKTKIEKKKERKYTKY
jgi:hypothetical protein